MEVLEWPPRIANKIKENGRVGMMEEYPSE
jgi:hypothetical protein